MDYKKAQGREIALLGRISKRRDFWLVPSQTRPGVKYKVCIADKRKSCSCPDFGTNGSKCKHIHAVIYKVDYPQPELVDRPTVPVEKKRKTYPQDWSNYNRAQTQEKDLLMRLLEGLCKTIRDEGGVRRGRPRIPLADAAFLACYKVYERSSARRFACDVGAAHRAGFISCEPHFNSVLNAMNDPRMTEVLMGFVKITSSPLHDFERTFAADSSGFTSCKYERWIDLKSSTSREQHTWTKVHLMCGTSTHIVTAVVIKNKDANDSPQFPPLLEQTAANFNVREVYADKAYASISNYEAAAQIGAVPYIPFKTNNSGSGKGRSGKEHTKVGGKLWAQMFHAFQYHREEFLDHYHLRSNVETVFSMVKAKFGGEVRCKTETAALNEVLSKLVCHNICVLISMMFEVGLDLDDLMPQRARGSNSPIIHAGL